MRTHKLTLAALTVVAGLSLTACQSDDDGKAAQSTPSSASTVSSPSGGSGSGGPDQSGGAGSAGAATTGQSSGGQDASAGKSTGGRNTSAGAGSDGGGTGTATGRAGKCRTDGLEITALDATIGGDTDRTVAVQLKNHSGRDCTLSGYAGVDLKTTSGPLSAKRTGEKAGSTVLRNGQSVAFGVHYPVNDSGGSGVRITGLVVTPPDETKSVTLAWPGADTLPVTDGTGSPVEVGPIGSAGQGG
ncbi:DUF4232 domain-containing protein [Streptomyces sp. SID161]|uniref:DUF4232 domain-containing protein n=1 Tax=Streptomyces sp. SID161 TaxID=2690251 RepID=UPI001368D0BD|nr:DUF4232 domain-containing protein [Streptomyces sp. SID161]MYW43687.1 DUF4232 domain-containing protein [Streptomyces sp. SID161]